MSRGSKPGERRGGRQPGTPNKVTRDVKELAQEYVESSIAGLAEIAQDKGAPHAARVAAHRELLDRACGKPSQTTDLTSSDGSFRPIGYAVIPEQAKGMEAWTQAAQSSSQIQKDE